MPLVSLEPVLKTALREKFAVAAFNPVDYGSMKAMVRAAEEIDAPVIIQSSAKTIRYYGHTALAGWMRELAADSPVPVVLHLDHGKDMDMIRRCIDSGWTSVMIDASDKPFEENLALTRQVVAWAEQAGIGVEAEIGEIGGVEEDLVVDEASVMLTDPEEAQRFCQALNLSAFAAQIGTAHGNYKREPKVAFELIAEINRRTQTPMALHGGTGLSEATFKRCIDLGCAKINISTHLKHVFIDSFVAHQAAHPGNYEPLSYLTAQFEALKELFKAKMTLFGGAGKGAALVASIN
ncbi:class II fructose-bisphosphate aldolase [Exilibacterium tricleocarpae]|uniref:Class II fructose-bisphosphate aldolase n=1 Tax=Exilibacterium tricleocarpae TaxID=2591008 RepID=A0A545TLS7_9GAMM|nr:class II fructose-bisphosphate aldolase [Exilibacterium tricleocarpae]TQV78195.1 class II fructose-bisphosphate aldolase [Exilibacterium tricleocarpae]